ncbi:helix-turn-helix domain-containing protein [Streptoalloteichus hindustanus]|uniref:Regulatory helix-turn-helix protein, lysR family n=1 Tax=Streptoalloteichus hindustanus TaxID=2017 RepID=A0A1M5GUM8_STRHI|nr:LysR family transcriptional regulator [Streptoalloteichus hindustanus]SHG07407.1 regulatory helix-turn-helix protein, lysR family [Streptoalloteichus hindustanus]
MHERELRAFVRIAELGRMDLAARALGYSQPAISYQIRCLEKTLGARLFHREPAGSRLTPDGHRILPWARAVLTLIENMREVTGARLPLHLMEPAAS